MPQGDARDLTSCFQSYERWCLYPRLLDHPGTMLQPRRALLRGSSLGGSWELPGQLPSNLLVVWVHSEANNEKSSGSEALTVILFCQMDSWRMDDHPGICTVSATACHADTATSCCTICFSLRGNFMKAWKFFDPTLPAELPHPAKGRS